MLLSTKATGLSKDAVAVPIGLELIDRALLGGKAGRLPAVVMEDVDEGICAVLGL